MTRIHNIQQPPQRLSYKSKTKKWRKDNIDFADTHSFYNNESVRKSLSKKVRNLNLYDGIVDIKDLTQTVNPYQMDASFIPDNLPHHPIVVPKIDLLVGEELKRRFDWRVMVTNQDAVSSKENDKKKMYFSKLQEYLQSNYSEEELESKMKELENYMKYDWQDIREKMANQILKHYWNEQEFDTEFSNGFKDALLVAEEIYQVDIVHDEPVMKKLNPLKVRSIRSGNSDRIEDSSLIIIEDHWSPGKIVDYFHDELKPKDIDVLLDYNNSSKGGNYSDDQNNHNLLKDALDANGEDFMDSLFGIAEINGHRFSSDYTDENGNIRVFRVYWKSLKQIKKVKFYTEEGDIEYKIRSSEYIEDENAGETSTSMWVNEWWEGTKLGKDIYLKMTPRKVQYNKLNNPSTCHPGIIGQVYNTNQGKAVALMDRCINYQYMYDAIWDRLNKAIATNYGKIFELDLAKVPDNWEIEKWLHFAVVNKIAVVDSFKEGKQGAATGKLAGGMNNNTSGSIDMETGSYIQQHIQLLEFIKMEMGEIAGVSKQREGAIHQNETASGVERSVNQSSHITEYWFATHEKVKLRVLNAFLETAKIALRGTNKKVQYILDDQTIQMLNIDGNEFAECDYGLGATSSSKGAELEQMLKQSAQAFMQNGGGMSTIMDIYFSPSLADMRRKLEQSEAEVNERNSKAADDQNKQAMAAQEQEMQLEQAKMQLEDIISQREDATKRYIAELGQGGEEGSSDGIIDPIASDKLQLDREKARVDAADKMRKLDDAMIMHKDKMQKEDKKIAASKQKKAV